MSYQELLDNEANLSDQGLHDAVLALSEQDRLKFVKLLPKQAFSRIVGFNDLTDWYVGYVNNPNNARLLEEIRRDKATV